MKASLAVDSYFRKVKRWKAELEQLRMILLDSPLVEELKWGRPCYTFETSNLAILYAMTETCAVGFLKGALLKDPKKVLTAPGEHSQSNRYFKFSSVAEITRMKPVLKAYIKEAIAVEKAGLKIDFKEKKELVYPEELESKLDKNAALKKAFAALTPGRQRGYVLFFSGAKQSETRASRVEKSAARILQGKGLHD